MNTVSDKSTKVAGKTEPYAKVKIYAAGKYVRTVQATKSGYYSIDIKKYKAGTTITLKSTDKAGNISKTTSMKVADKTPPATPKVGTVTANTTKLKGKANPAIHIM